MGIWCFISGIVLSANEIIGVFGKAWWHGQRERYVNCYFKGIVFRISWWNVDEEWLIDRSDNNRNKRRKETWHREMSAFEAFSNHNTFHLLQNLNHLTLKLRYQEPILDSMLIN